MHLPPCHGNKKSPPSNVSGRHADNTMKGRNIKLENNVFSVSTGITALFFNDCFLNTS